MKKTYFAGFIAVAIIAFGVMAVPKTMAAKQIKDRSVTIEGATPENPVVSLGKAFDKKSGKMVEGYAIVHYAKSASKPSKPSSTASCFGYLAKGAKWKTMPGDWTVDNQHTGGLTLSKEFDILDKSISKWELASGNKVDLGKGAEASISGTLGQSPDEKHEVTFASITNADTIAVTYIWGILSGPVFGRELVDWDQIYNDHYSWSDSGETGKMDFENIATHELGHSVGMGDLYTSSCSTQTMYGLADYGQINKQDLHDGDIAGIRALYN